MNYTRLQAGPDSQIRSTRSRRFAGQSGLVDRSTPGQFWVVCTINISRWNKWKAQVTPGQSFWVQKVFILGAPLYCGQYYTRCGARRLGCSGDGNSGGLGDRFCQPGRALHLRHKRGAGDSGERRRGNLAVWLGRGAVRPLSVRRARRLRST
jgi:hypothetical protein